MRPWLPLFFAIVLLANLLHCATHAATTVLEAGNRVQRLADEGAPLNLPLPACAHEFGCVCRGATVVAMVTVERDDIAAWNTQTHVTCSFDACASDICRIASLGSDHSLRRFLSTFTALEMRAWISSFVI